MSNVKCKDCGFLALRLTETFEICEADELFRDQGVVPEVFIPGKGDRERYMRPPCCFVRAANFRQEMANAENREEGQRVISQLRDCDKFTPWQQGHAPKEHYEMLQLEKQREWQRQMAEDERTWRKNQAERERQWRKEDIDLAKQSMRSSVWTQLAVAAIGVAAGLAAAGFGFWLAN